MQFSVAMCVWAGDDAQRFLSAANSCLQQDLLPSQFVLVVDGPIGASSSVNITNIEQSCAAVGVRFDMFTFSKNVGHGLARRKSIEMCCHDVIAISDADDINLKCRFYDQIKHLTGNKDLSIVGGYVLEYSESSENISKIRKVPLEHHDIVKYSRFRCPMNQMTVMFKKSDILEVGGYQDFYNNEDYFLWCRLIISGKKLSNIPKVLVHAFVNDASYFRRGGLRYFTSEINIQRFMLRNGMTNIFFFLFNTLIRFFIQLCIPSSIRRVLFQRFFRGDPSPLDRSEQVRSRLKAP